MKIDDPVVLPFAGIVQSWAHLLGAGVKLVAPSFAFLEAHGFRLSATEDSSAWETWQYTSAVSAVRVTRSNEFVRADVHLIRLVDGQVPAYPIWITSERMNWALLDNVLEVRTPDLLRQVAGGLFDPELRTRSSLVPTWLVPITTSEARASRN